MCAQFGSTRENKAKIKKKRKEKYKKKVVSFGDFVFEKIEFEKLLDKRVFDRPFILRILPLFYFLITLEIQFERGEIRIR